MRFAVVLLALASSIALPRTWAASVFYPVTRSMTCAALLMTLRDDGHLVPEVTKVSTETTVQSLHAFRREILKQNQVNPSHTAITTNSRHSERAIEVAARIVSIEDHLKEINSPKSHLLHQPQSTEDDHLKFWASTISGKSSILKFLTDMKRVAALLQSATQTGMTFVTGPMAASNAIATGALGIAAFNVAMGDHIPQDALPNLAILAAAWAPDLIPQILISTEIGKMSRFLTDVQRLLTEGQPNEWAMHSRNDHLMKNYLEGLTSGKIWNGGARIVEAGNTPWFQETKTSSPAVIRLASWLVSNLTGNGANHRLHEVLTDLLLFIDDDGIPHLAVVARFDAKHPEIQSPRRPRRRRGIADDLIPGIPAFQR